MKRCRPAVWASRRAQRLSVAMVPLALLVASSPAAAQSLDEALATAYQTNPDLSAAEAGLRRSDEGVSQALAGWRPSADLSVGGGYAADLAGTSSGSQQSTLSSSEGAVVSFDFRVRQPIYNFITPAMVEQAKSNVKAERARLTATEQDVLLHATTAYLDVLRNQAILEETTRQQQQLERDLATAQRRFELGELRNSDVAQSEASVARARSQRTVAEGNLATARAAYVQVIGRPPETLTLPPEPQGLPASQEEAVARSADAPAVIAANYAVRAASDGVDISNGQQLPQFALQGDAGAANQSILAVMTVPLARGGALDSQVRASKQLQMQREQEREAQLRQAQQAAVQAWQSYQSAKSNVDSSKAQLKSAQLAADGIRREASLGLRTVTDVLIAQQQVLDADVSLITAQRDTLLGAYQLLAADGGLTAQGLGLDVPYYNPRAHYDQVRTQLWGSEAEQGK